LSSPFLQFYSLLAACSCKALLYKV
jgi:hypothetical protein